MNDPDMLSQGAKVEYISFQTYLFALMIIRQVSRQIFYGVQLLQPSSFRCSIYTTLYFVKSSFAALRMSLWVVALFLAWYSSSVPSRSVRLLRIGVSPPRESAVYKALVMSCLAS